jgi:hypothetical protein
VNIQDGKLKIVGSIEEGVVSINEVIVWPGPTTDFPINSKPKI